MGRNKICYLNCKYSAWLSTNMNWTLCVGKSTRVICTRTHSHCLVSFDTFDMQWLNGHFFLFQPFHALLSPAKVTRSCLFMPAHPHRVTFRTLFPSEVRTSHSLSTTFIALPTLILINRHRPFVYMPNPFSFCLRHQFPFFSIVITFVSYFIFLFSSQFLRSATTHFICDILSVIVLLTPPTH